MLRLAPIIAAFVLFVTPPAAARSVEPGSLTVGGGAGSSIRIGSLLDAGRAYLTINGHADYSFTSQISIVTDLSLGIGSAFPFRLHFGGRYRFTDLNLPISPYAQGQLSVGRLYGVLGANLTYVGLRAGGGADYFFTKTMSAGGFIGLDGGYTTGDRPALFSVVDLLVYANYTF